MNHDMSQPSFELPPLPAESDTVQGGQTEQVPARPEQSIQPAAPALHPSAPMPAVVPVPLPVSGAPIQPVSQSSATAPLTADDNDLIEKEWVQKAKQIVAATKDDPYVQNREISKFKADYLKKRYNKDVKIEEA